MFFIPAFASQSCTRFSGHIRICPSLFSPLFSQPNSSFQNNPFTFCSSLDLLTPSSQNSCFMRIVVDSLRRGRGIPLLLSSLCCRSILSLYKRHAPTSLSFPHSFHNNSITCSGKEPAETRDDPFLGSAVIDEETFDSRPSPQDYSNNRPLDAIGVDRQCRGQYLHIPLFLLLSEPIQSFIPLRYLP